MNKWVNDKFKLWPEAYALLNQEFRTVLFIKNTRHGIPQHVHLDRRRNFKSKLSIKR